MKSVLFVILLAGACALVTSPASGQVPPVPVGGNIRPPTKIKEVAPVYPADAQRAGISGPVILEAIVGEDGKVRSTRVLRSIPQLDQAAINAVQQWEFTPTLINGVAVPIVTTVTVNFALQGRPPALPMPLPNTIRVFATRGQNGQTLAWDIDVTRAMGLPKWNTDGEPPLSLSEATRLARSWIAGRGPQAGGFVLQSAALLRRPLPPTPQNQSNDAELWFYQIAYSRDAGVASAQNPPSPAIVLLDGSVLEPREIPDLTAQALAPPSASVPLPPGATPPRPLQQVRANYTSEALRRKITGSVLIQGIIGLDGTFQSLRIVRSLDSVYGLDDEALKAARQWRFAPGMKDGQPVPVEITIEISFSVRSSP
jgi:TonB family protein